MAATPADAPDSPLRAFLRRVIEVGLVTAELAIFAYAAKLLWGDGRAFRRMFLLIIPAYAVFQLAPRRLRGPILALVSLGTAFLTIGRVHAPWLTGLVLAATAILATPMPKAARAGLAALGLAVLAWGRVDPAHTPWSVAIMPLAGTMLVLRGAMLLWQAERARTDPWSVVAYLSMVPSTCFPVFPPVLPSTFAAAWHDEGDVRRHQAGVAAIVRGFVEFFIHKALVLGFVTKSLDGSPPLDLRTGLVLVPALYFQITGTFRMAIGILRLFDVDLPSPTRGPAKGGGLGGLLAGLNTYYSTLVLELAYRPLFQRLEPKRGRSAAIIIAGSMATLLGWAFLVVQWFWLAGDLEHLFENTVVALGLGLLGIGAAILGGERRERSEHAPSPLRLGRSVALTLALVGLLVLAGRAPRRISTFAPEVADFISSLTAPAPDDGAMVTHYWLESLASTGEYSRPLEAVYYGRPADWINPLPVIERKELPLWVLRPDTKTRFKSKTLTINHLGMRDREYSKEKPAGTYRFVLLGQSLEVGSGVEDGEPYESLVEARLNAERSAKDGVRYEILNGAVSGYGPMNKLAKLETVVPEWQPDAIIFVSIADVGFVLKELNMIHRKPEREVLIPWPDVRELVRKAGVELDTPALVAAERLAPHGEELVGALYDKVGDDCRRHGWRCFGVVMAQAEPKLTALERTLEASHIPMVGAEASLFRKAGLETLDASDLYDKTPDLSAMWLGPWDHHPNAVAHRMMAERLYAFLDEALTRQPPPRADAP